MKKLLEIPVNKQKIINDPVFGFIGLPYDIVYDLFEHPYFQRLRRIKQLGLTNFVYPGANHTRFQHALGANYLMSMAIEVIRSKGHEITEKEAEGVSIAILLHDIGHGPFSHALEHSIIEGASHESISLEFMYRLNKLYKGKLDLAIKIFRNTYHKKFLHQLVSSQLDMDRLDYLRRDSYFTGVTEGVVGSDRIIKMLNVKDDQLVIDIKGIYSIEKFLVSRRLMYWQVYFHKTVISSENLLVQLLKRAKYLSENGEELFASPAFSYFLKNKVKARHFSMTEPVDVLEYFSQLDDNDLMVSAKVWMSHRDKVLSMLSSMLINRRLFKIEMKNKAFDPERVQKIRDYLAVYLKISADESRYLVTEGSISNYAYNSLDDNIKIMLKNGECKDVAEVSDMLNVTVLSRTVKKHFLCYPKEIELPF